MSRAEDCVQGVPHMHVGQCQRAGYANGMKDVAEAIQAVIDEWSVPIPSDDPDQLYIEVDRIREALA